VLIVVVVVVFEWLGFMVSGKWNCEEWPLPFLWCVQLLFSLL